MRNQSSTDSESGSPRKSREERRRWVARYRKSGMSARSFAEKHGLNVWTLRNWTEQWRGKTTARLPEMREVVAPWEEPAGRSPEWIAEVRFPNGWVVRWKEGLKTSAAKTLLKALRPC